MKRNRLADFRFDLAQGLTSGDAPRQIRHVSRVISDCLLNNDCVTHKTSLQTSLFENAILSANSQIVAGLARNRHTPWFGCVRELPVATPGCDQFPSVALDDPENFAYLHSPRIAATCWRDKSVRCNQSACWISCVSAFGICTIAVQPKKSTFTGCASSFGGLLATVRYSIREMGALSAATRQSIDCMDRHGLRPRDDEMSGLAMTQGAVS